MGNKGSRPSRTGEDSPELTPSAQTRSALGSISEEGQPSVVNQEDFVDCKLIGKGAFGKVSSYCL
jgi:hypothetical protein